MKKLSVILTALAIIVLAVAMFWKPTIATPNNTGLTQEARTELANTLRH